jgi:hypothetical protein
MATIRGASRPGRDFGPPITIGPTLARWGAIIAGTVAGIGTFLLLSALWTALAVESDVDFVGDNLEWFGVVSAVIALAVAGFLAGFLSGLRGVGPGAVNGLSAWGLFVTVSLLVGAPSAAARLDQPIGIDAIEEGAPLWAGFWAVVAGLAIALIFGALGGLVTRPRELFETKESIEERVSAYGDPRLDLTDQERRPTRAPTPGA